MVEMRSSYKQKTSFYLFFLSYALSEKKRSHEVTILFSKRKERFEFTFAHIINVVKTCPSLLKIQHVQN